MMPFGGKSVFLQKFVVDDFLRRLDGHEEASADQRVLLGRPLARRPSAVVGASKKMHPDLARRQHGVGGDPVHETLKLVHPVLDKLVFVTTCVKEQNKPYFRRLFLFQIKLF